MNQRRSNHTPKPWNLAKFIRNFGRIPRSETDAHLSSGNIPVMVFERAARCSLLRDVVIDRLGAVAFGLHGNGHGHGR